MFPQDRRNTVDEIRRGFRAAGQAGQQQEKGDAGKGGVGHGGVAGWDEEVAGKFMKGKASSPDFASVPGTGTFFAPMFRSPEIEPTFHLLRKVHVAIRFMRGNFLARRRGGAEKWVTKSTSTPIGAAMHKDGITRTVNGLGP